MKLLARNTLFLFVALSGSLSGFSQQINIFPTILNFDLASPGTVQSQTINITNNSNKKQAIEAYFGDWTRNEDGSHAYYDPGSKLFSCADWAKLNTNFLSLEAGETKQIVLTLQAPEDPEQLKEMKWAMTFIQITEVKEAQQPEPGKVMTQINEILRFGLHVYQTPPHLKKMAIELKSLLQNTENPKVFDLGVENIGELMLYTRSHIELTNISTGEEFKTEHEECPIFPLTKRKVSLHLPEDLPSGKYSMLAVLDYGDPNSLEAVERIVEIK